jgi:hypothetical protein
MNWRAHAVTRMTACVLLLSACTGDHLYEVVERTQKEIPNFQSPGLHIEVGYVLLQEGHKIHATCDFTDVDRLDPNATCGLRPLRKYACRLGQRSGDKALSDLLCQDDDGHNVYLYVSKKE